MATEDAADTRSGIVRVFDTWPKPLRVILFALAVSFAVVMTIGYVAQARWWMAIVWVVVTAIWSLIGLVRLAEADRYARRGTSG